MHFRKYGEKPIKVAVIHGGPGAPGEMAPVARRLSLHFGIFEPIQTAMTVSGQIEELAELIRTEMEFPAILIGYSWGAWLSGMVAVRFPELVQSLILISAGPFEEQYAGVFKNRMDRLTSEEQQEVSDLIIQMNDPSCTHKDLIMSRFGEFMHKTDTYHPGPDLCRENDLLPCNCALFIKVWDQAAKLRKSGDLLEMCKRIRCPIVAIHGDYDPHPSEGVKIPLTRVIPDFRFILLKHCGHCPWMEAEAADMFFSILEEELSEKLSLSIR